MPEYLITFNDEWVPPHTEEQIKAKSVSSRAVIAEMQAADVLLFSNGGLDESTALFSVEAVDGEAIFSDGPFMETKEHLGGFAAIDVPDDDTARYWAGRLAVALEWPQEVHRFGGAGEARRLKPTEG
ncbi:YciI family protein [Actinoplanes sp. NPDC026670]|uniref:YciI family protein n=1 Tax=Actinoplanes sp. NPDC026670 TaxID=3154700 RepID=UPI0033F8FD13